jgi:hypothetical protein
VGPQRRQNRRQTRRQIKDIAKEKKEYREGAAYFEKKFLNKKEFFI